MQMTKSGLFIYLGTRNSGLQILVENVKLFYTSFLQGDVQVEDSSLLESFFLAV